MAKGKRPNKKFPKDYPTREESKKKYEKWEDKVKDDIKSRDCYAGKANDPLWYAQNPSLLRDAASFPYGWPVGNRLDLEAGPVLNDASIPGVMAFYVIPSFGNAVSENDPINMAARNIYAYVRHANSGHTNYDAPDLMLYLLAMDSVYSYHSFLKRVYGLARSYTPINRYYPKALLTAMGIDYDDVMSNLAQLRYGINVLQAKFNAMRIPKSMSYMARHMWMYTNVYQDGDTDKCQTYFYTPHAFYQYGYASDGSGMLQYVEFMKGFTGTALYTVQELIDFGNSLINPILASEDMGIMSGDILKAFGEGNLVSLIPVDTNYVVVPEYNTEVLSQMENVSMIGYPQSGSANVTQEGVDPTTQLPHAWLTYSPIFMHPNGVNGFNPSFASITNSTTRANTIAAMWMPNTMKRIINFHKDDVQASDTMVATRLTNILTPGSWPTNAADMNNFTATCSTLGSEFVASAAIFYYAGNGSAWQLRSSGYIFTTMLHRGRESQILAPTLTSLTSGQITSLNGYMDGTNTATDIAQLDLLLARLSIFDWHPMVSVVDVELRNTYSLDAQGGVVMAQGIGSVNNPRGFYYDVENYTTMVKHDLERLSEAAILSEFSVSAMGGSNRTV